MAIKRIGANMIQCFHKKTEYHFSNMPIVLDVLLNELANDDGAIVCHLVRQTEESWAM